MITLIFRTSCQQEGKKCPLSPKLRTHSLRPLVLLFAVTLMIASISLSKSLSLTTLMEKRTKTELNIVPSEEAFIVT